MKRTIRIFSLLIILFLLPLSVSGEEDLAGRWTGTVDEGIGTLLLERNGSFIMLYDDDKEVFVDIGLWSLQTGIIELTMPDNTTMRLQYTLQGDTLTVQEEGVEDLLSFTRSGPWTPPEGIVGEWEGKDVSGVFVLALRPDNHFTFDYVSGEPIGSGNFADYQGNLYLVFSNDTYLVMGYTLAGDNMTIKNQFTGDSYPMTRRQTLEPDPTAPPATMSPEQTQETEPEATPEHPDWLSDTTPEPVPEETASPEPTQMPAVTSGLAGTWQGTNTLGTRTIHFSANGFISIAYSDPANEALGKDGTFTSTSDMIIADYEDGSGETFRFILMGDNLLLTDQNLQNPVTYTRIEEERIDPALTGTWGGFGEIGYFEYSFGEDGTVTLMVLPDETRSLSGTASTQQGVLSLSDQNGEVKLSYSIREGILILDDTIKASKMTGPIVREPFPQDPPSAAVDPSLLGVWGIMEEDAYLEYIFLPDGKYERFCPSDEKLNTAGNHMANGGNLAILTLDGSSQGTYNVDGDTLTLTITGKNPIQLLRKDGILKRLE